MTYPETELLNKEILIAYVSRPYDIPDSTISKNGNLMDYIIHQNFLFWQDFIISPFAKLPF